MSAFLYSKSTNFNKIRYFVSHVNSIFKKIHTKILRISHSGLWGIFVL